MLFVTMACALAAVTSAFTCKTDSELLRGRHSGTNYCRMMEREGFTIERAAECSLCPDFSAPDPSTGEPLEMYKWYMQCHVDRMANNGQLQIEYGEDPMKAHREWYWEVVKAAQEHEFPTLCPDPPEDSAPAGRPVPQRGGAPVQAAVPARGAPAVPARGAPTMRGLGTTAMATNRLAAPRRGLEEEQSLVPELEEVERVLAELE